LILTTVLHVALISVIMFRGSEEQSRTVAPASPLTIFDIGEQATEDDAADKGAGTESTSTAITADVESPRPAEWSMVAVRVAQPATAPGTSIGTEVRSSGTAGGGYDPYAGAAPETFNRSSERSSASRHESAAPGFEPALRKLILEIEPNIRFPLRVRLSLDSRGFIVRAKIVEPVLPKIGTARVEAGLRGAHIATTAPTSADQARQFEVVL
jgi:hypothetical protein